MLAEVEGMQWGTFKPLLAEAIVQHLDPIQTRYREIMAHPSDLDDLLHQARQCCCGCWTVVTMRWLLIERLVFLLVCLPHT